MVQPWLIAILAGIVAHRLVFIRGEWHLTGPYVAISHLLAFFSASLLSGEIRNVLLLSTLYLSGLFGSIAVYRVFFHKLRRFPGPTAAAITKLWHVWKCRDSKNHTVLDEVHKQYGQFVRTGPNEITIFHPAVFETMDGPGNNHLRSEWYDLIHPRTSTVFSRRPQDHLDRRQPWQKALSSKAINQYLPRIRKQIATLEELIEQAESRPVLVNEIMQWYAHDAMGEFAFNESFGMMKSAKWHRVIEQQRAALTLLGPMSMVIWLIRICLALFPFAPGVKAWNNMLEFCDERMDRRRKTEPAEPDIAKYFIEDIEENSLKLDAAAQRNLLSGNTLSVIIGGSDTVGPTLIIIFYLLASHPVHANKMYEELKQLPTPYDPQTLALLEHLNAVINEGLRLIPSALTTGTRITGPNGLKIDDTFIPPDTKIVAPRYPIFRMESCFERATEFIPERWTTRPELIKDRRAFAPFGVGRRGCVGKNLALVQLRFVLANLITRYKFRFPDGFDESRVELDMKDQFTAQVGQVSLIFEPRQ